MNIIQRLTKKIRHIHFKDKKLTKMPKAVRRVVAFKPSQGIVTPAKYRAISKRENRLKKARRLELIQKNRNKKRRQ